jgi:hypothetical protein
MIFNGFNQLFILHSVVIYLLCIDFTMAKIGCRGVGRRASNSPFSLSLLKQTLKEFQFSLYLKAPSQPAIMMLLSNFNFGTFHHSRTKPSAIQIFQKPFLPGGPPPLSYSPGRL